MKKSWNFKWEKVYEPSSVCINKFCLLKDNLFQGKGEKSPGKTSLPSTLHNWATFEIPEKVTLASASSLSHFVVVMQMKLDFTVGYTLIANMQKSAFHLNCA